MDLLNSLRDLGVADPAADSAGEQTVRAALAREIDKATVAQRASAPNRFRRRIRLTVPALAVAAGVAAAAVVVTGGADGSHAAQGNGGGGPSAAQSIGSRGSFHAHDTAYIIKRVRAKVAHASPSSMVQLGYAYDSGDVNSDGSLANLGGMYQGAFDYIAPDGTTYERDVHLNADGSPWLASTVVHHPGDASEATQVNYVTHTYSQRRFRAGPPVDSTKWAPNLLSSSSAVQQALRNGQVSQMGTTTVDGTQATALLLKMPAGALPGPTNETSSLENILYVNAQTYQPLQMVQSIDVGSSHVLSVSEWVPATPANIAKAQDDSIPAGYTEGNPEAGTALYNPASNQ